MNKQAFIAGYQKESSDRIEKSLDWITGLFPDYYDKSPYARKMLRETVRQETLDNAYRGSGHDGGVAQITRDTFKDLMNLKHKHPKTYRRIQNSPAKSALNDLTYEKLTKNPHLSMLLGAIKYMTIPEPIPSTQRGRARYWKKYYNTKDGAGTIKKFLRNQR